MEDRLADEILVTTLRFWIKKIRRGDCTREQRQAVLNALDTNADILATIDELADFYGKSKDAVNSVIKRSYMGKPRRNIVMYSFSKFRDAVPKSWRENTDKSSS